MAAGEEHTTVILLDLEKAYDRVGWEFLQAALTTFSFGPRFKHLVRSLYLGATSRLAVNGRLSPRLALERSVRQRCLGAPYLYLIYVEVMHVIIRAHPGIPVFLLPSGNHLKVESFADDSVAFTPMEDHAFQSLQRAIELFCKISQAKVNWTKSSLLIPSGSNPPLH